MFPWVLVYFIALLLRRVSTSSSIRFPPLNIPDLLEGEDAAMALDSCVTAREGDCDVMGDVMLYLGLSGTVNVDFRAAMVGRVVDLGSLRKTRADGNWLIGGILELENLKLRS